MPLSGVRKKKATNVQDTFRIKFTGMPAHADAEVEIRAWLEKLAPLCAGARMTGGQITIAAVFEHHRNRQGLHYQVLMQLGTEGEPITVGPSDVGNVPHDDIFVAIRNGFRSVRRQLLGAEALRLARGEVPLSTSACDDPLGVAAPGAFETSVEMNGSASPDAGKLV